MSLDVLVADDEPPALHDLAAMLRADDRIGVVHTARNGAEALRILETAVVQAAFLDIHMPGMSGLDLARAFARLRARPAIVFVTADDAGAVEAFDLDAVDYVLKPVRVERLRRAIGRAVEAAAEAAAGASDGGPEAAAAAGESETIPVTVGSTTRMVRRSDVRWVQAQGDYSRLRTAVGDHLVRVPLSELAERWAHAGFIRVHRSYLVHRDAIVEVRLSGPAPTVGLAEIELPVSRRLVPAVREALLPRPTRGQA
ncbi:response regulator transcription factor [Microbacterium sp. dk485]|uniref:LytR/AlgR family response regulator transcription factor n=1 Tax=Microbacterium sp. dk485 TaxID=2560021 RepID=UPI0010741828|nr:LytTR family DNA-binding domain-containing protein [Microbacterium sp. dk485]TFV84530.1 response regulator transcription factor [Microbacterium sp. dk485]